MRPGLLATLLLLAVPAFAQVQTKDQQACTVALNKQLQKVTGAVAKDAAGCIKAAGKGTLTGTADDCLVADAAGKIAKEAAKTDAEFAKRCTGNSTKPPMVPRFPPYGATTAATVTTSGTDAARGVVRSAFGANLDAALVAEAESKDAAKCQQAVAKQLAKCQDAWLKEFLACKAAGLKAATSPIDSPDALAACLGADPKSKIAKQCDLRAEPEPGKLVLDKLRQTLAKSCVDRAVGLATVFPGCAADDPEAAHACLDAAVACGTCQAVNQADGLTIDCDALDDGAVNGSCGASTPPLGRHECTLDPEASGFFFDTAIFTDLFTLEGSIAVDCGVVDPTTGRAPCTCEVVDVPPEPILPGIGVACVAPATGCATGEISCNGGGLFNGAMTSDHDTGSCASNAACAASCATTCGSAAVFDSACEGFCRGGANDDQACSTNADCPGGTCNGIDGAEHGNVCQCECLDASGDPAPAGGMRCNLGVRIVAELEAPCGDGDVLFEIGTRCVPLTTELVQGVIRDLDAVPDAELASSGNPLVGVPRACGDLAASGASGLSLVSSVNVLDVDLAGDTAFGFVLTCE